MGSKALESALGGYKPVIVYLLSGREVIGEVRESRVDELKQRVIARNGGAANIRTEFGIAHIPVCNIEYIEVR